MSLQRFRDFLTVAFAGMLLKCRWTGKSEDGRESSYSEIAPTIGAAAADAPARGRP